MPVAKELVPFFTRLVEKSKKSEINWRDTGQADAFRVTFRDMAVTIEMEGNRLVRIQLLNDRGDVVEVITVDDDDDEWLGAVGLINSAKRKVTKKDVTMRRVMEELAKDGPIGEEPA